MADAFLKQYGGSGADSSDCTAKKSQVLAGVTAITSDSNDGRSRNHAGARRTE